MKVIRIIAVMILAATALVSAGAGVLAPYDYAEQFRDYPDSPPSRRFPLGTDELGRDRLSRLLYGGRTSLLCAPVAAAIATVLATFVGVAAGFAGGWLDAVARGAMDLFLSLPWLFALLTARALIPLNVSAWVSIAMTFLLLAVLGWAAGARVIRASVTGMKASAPVLQAQAYGTTKWRLLTIHILPNLKPIVTAQFWILVPVFLLTEANLGVLGLGISEPIPSWGNMLSELQNYSRVVEAPWILAPAIALVLVVASLHFVISGSNTWE